ncbi:DegT/DnrJ/EryC1/StrS family aminotransferase [Salinispora mooreana]|uniref:DegT/DnrJ/EryC1/StrS family aminotransferase n=1 Tax=Salinispora mooreana TaxID=999545 RepID=UPI00036218FB|nr:DegT/DnrJ/EryC1/StrS family aminotransferase [Salinispora mooreana]
MTIPFHTNSRQHHALAHELTSALATADLTDDSAFNREVQHFEQRLARYAGSRFAVGTASGTDALTIALTALDLPRGGEVILCGFGFFASAAAIVRAGLTPVLVDTQSEGYVIDPAAAEAAITSRTVALLPVHMFGEAAHMRRLSQLAVDHGIALVEDCAQALGAYHGDHAVGTFGDSAAVSFNWSKHLSCTSNGGAVLTNDEHQIETLQALRAYGSTSGFWHPLFGLNSRLNPFEARVLAHKLPHLDSWISRRRTIAERYWTNLAGVAVALPPVPEGMSTHVYHKFTVAHPDRDRLRHHLKAHGIGSMVCYPHLLGDHPPIAAVSRSEDLTHAKQRAATALSIPIWPELTNDEVDRICQHIDDFCGAS